YKFEYGKCDVIREGKDCTIMTLGSMLPMAIAACESLAIDGIGATVYNVTSPLHIDKATVHEAATTGLVVTYEDHVADSGLGSIVAQLIARANIQTKFVQLGIDQYGASDSAENLYKRYGLGPDSLVRTIRETL
ncbi:hypothetical protein AMJ83_11315, partial [candidate division WOR_3 bacterium SM23_42]